MRSGRWTALRRGVYCETDQLPLDPVGRHAAEVLAAASATVNDVVGSHESAAMIHGLATFTRYTGPPAPQPVPAP